mgnify:CR=1 FL=1
MFAVCKYMESVDLSGLQTDRRSCQKTIYTPFNVNVDVPLHGEKDSNVWRGVISGEQKELTEMVKRQHLFPGIKQYQLIFYVLLFTVSPVPDILLRMSLR